MGAAPTCSCQVGSCGPFFWVHTIGVGVQADVVLCDPEIQIDTLNGSMLDQQFVCQIIHLEASYVIWVGTSAETATLANMSTAVNTRFEKSPIVTTLLGQGLDEGSGMAQRLAKKCGAMAFVSCNLDAVVDEPHRLAAYIERQLTAKLCQSTT